MWDGGHRQASILPNKKVMWLRFKIFVGYITLITLWRSLFIPSARNRWRETVCDRTSVN